MRRRAHHRYLTYPRSTPGARAAALSIDAVDRRWRNAMSHGLVIAAAITCLLLVALALATAVGAATLATTLALSLAAAVGAGITWAALRTLGAGHRSL